MNTAKRYIRLPSKNRDSSIVETNDRSILALQSNLNDIKHASDNLSLAIDKIADYLNNNISLPQIEKHLDDISTQTNTLIDDYNAHFVSPSVIGNFVNFSDTSGSQSDSGWSYQDFALFDHKHTVLVKPQTDTEILYINTFGNTTILSGLSVSGGQTLSGTLTVSGNVYSNSFVSGISGFFQSISGDIGKFGSGTNFTNFDGTGHQSMSGTAKPWRDQLTDSLNLQQNGVGISTNASEGTVDFAYNSTYNATFSLSDALYTNIQLNHDKELSGQLHPHIHWFQEKNYIPNFLIEYRWQVNGGTKVTGWTKLKCNTNAFNYVSGSIHQLSYSSGITPPSGSNLSDIVQFRIYRDTTNASTEFSGVCPYNTSGNASVGILAFDVHFQINSLGSTDELVK